MTPIEFKYSDNASYPYSNAFNVQSIEIINQNIVITPDNKDVSVFFFKMSLENTRSHMLSQMLLSKDGVQIGCSFGKIN